jgi:hypothetical protein
LEAVYIYVHVVYGSQNFVIQWLKLCLPEPKIIVDPLL